jgi:hypothetical protein
MIARLCENIGALMGLHGSDLTALKFAALAHDIGERVMKRNYLLRPNALTWEETLDLWRHPILGEQAAGELRLSRHTQLLIRWHHEWWNGLGYPDGLAGESIPLGARILRMVDSYYALISNRPYRQRFDAFEAEQIIADLAGIEFDPQIVKLLLAILAEERIDHEVEPLTVASEVETQILLTPEGLQTAFVPTEFESEADEIDTFSQAEESAPRLLEAAVDDGDEVPDEREGKLLESISSELPSADAETFEPEEELETPPGTCGQPPEAEIELNSTEEERPAEETQPDAASENAPGSAPD